MREPAIRPAVSTDLEALARINDSAAPAVPVTTVAELRALLGMSELALVVDDGTPAGFLLAMVPGLPYASENYAWFSERSAAFLYVDRIVLDPRMRGAGLGRRLYRRVIDRARELGATEVVCEVNLQPPNPASLAFHRRLGFVEVGRQWTKGASTEVVLLAVPLDGSDR